MTYLVWRASVDATQDISEVSADDVLWADAEVTLARFMNRPS